MRIRRASHFASYVLRGRCSRSTLDGDVQEYACRWPLRRSTGMSGTQAFKNGRIFTATGQDELVDFLVIRDGLVDYVGEQGAYAGEDIESLVSEAQDLNGQVLLPGFIDSHTHLEMMGHFLGRVNLIGCNTLADVQAALVAHHKANPDVKRILGRSWLFDIFGANGEPTRQMLDGLFPDVPVYLDANDLHSCWLNGAALKEIGVDDSVRNPQGGEFARDKEGHLTGFLLETALTEYVWPFLARETSAEQRIEAMQAAFEAYLATGVTGAIEMAGTTEHLEALEALYIRHGKSLPIRTWVHIIITVEGTAEDRLRRVDETIAHRERLRKAEMDDWLQVVGIKIISDGVIDACTAFMKEPYGNGTGCNPIWEREDLAPVIVKADAADMQIAVHAIGDAASEMALDLLEAAAKANGPSPTRRHRLEHLESITSESITRIAALGVTASLQPVHADPILAFNWMAQLGHDHRCERAFPWSEFRKAGCNIALGTDAPTAPYETLPNLYIATNRKSALKPDMPWPPAGEAGRMIVEGARQVFGIKEAIIGATRGAAYSCRMENKLGSLAKGLAADFCILAEDPFERGTAGWCRGQEGVLETWVGGKRVYKRK